MAGADAWGQDTQRQGLTTQRQGSATADPRHPDPRHPEPPAFGWVATLFWLGFGALAISADVALANRRRLQCSTKYFPARLHSGHRVPGQIHLIVLHSTESTGTGAAVASYFQSASSGGSTQLVVGEDGCYRSVSDLEDPAGAPGANSDGLHIEIVGLAKWSRDEWFQRAPIALDLAAKALADWSKAYAIPLVYVDAAGLRQPNARGVTTHKDVSVAFKKSDHWDPGSGFPLDWLLQRARVYL